MSQQGGGKGPPRVREGSTMFESFESCHDFISAIARNRSEQRRLTARYLDAVAAGNDKSADKFNKLAEKHFHRSFELVYETVRVFDTCVSNVDCDAEDYTWRAASRETSGHCATASVPPRRPSARTSSSSAARQANWGHWSQERRESWSTAGSRARFWTT